MTREHEDPPRPVVARYPSLADTTVIIHHIGGGHVSCAWRITTDTGVWLLRRLPAEATTDTAAATTAVQAHAARIGLAPELVANDTGELVTTTDGRMFTLTTYLERATAPLGVPSVEICHQLGNALGCLHQQLRQIRTTELRPWQLAGPAAVREALRAHDQPGCRHPAARRVLQIKLARALAIPARARARLNDLEPQVIHGDVHPSNILLTSTGAMFIDFDLARSAPPGYELVRALIYCTHPAGSPQVYRDRVAAFLFGYLTTRPLTELEITTMVELYRTVQVLDPYGLHACQDAREHLLGFGYARFALLYWLTRHGPGLTALAHDIHQHTG